MKKVHQTSDGRKFYTENHAKNHAKTLEDKSVKEVEHKEETPKKETSKK